MPMKTPNPYLQRELKHFLYTFKRMPLLLKRGRGAQVWDEKGRKYYDFFSGIAVCGVGHNHPKVVKAIQRQAGNLLHCSNYFYTEPQLSLAKTLTSRLLSSRVFFSNSGAEANELAIKLARLWAEKHHKPGREILTFLNSFHGRTLATAAASGGMYRASNQVFHPLPAGFKSVPFNDLEKVKRAITKKTIAIMVEPIQGEGGIHIATRSFLKGLSRLCRERKLLLIVDEVQSGMGRTGTFFAFEQYGIKPDIISLAKGLAGGLPLGATLAMGPVAKFVQPGLHGSTFGGNPVSCAASLEVLKMLTPQALASIRKLGNSLLHELEAFKAYSSVKAVRGKGLMLAIELNRPGAAYVTLAREKGLLINCTHDVVLRFLPPYFMTPSDIKECLRRLKSVFDILG